MALFEQFAGDPYEKPGAPSRVPGMKSTFAEYIKSPIYKRRLQQSGVKDPDRVIKERLQKLDEIRLTVGPSESLSYIWMGKPNQKEPLPALTVRPTSSDYTTMHELSHVTNYGDVFFDPAKHKSQFIKHGDMNTASGKGMSFNEMMKFADKAIIKSKPFKDRLMSAPEDAKKWGVYQNPAEGIRGADPHGFDPSEFKSDLDAVRLLLKREGLTKKFGDDIDEGVIERAIKNPKVANEPHFQRLMKSFKKKDIVELNNTIAMSNGLARATMA